MYFVLALLFIAVVISARGILMYYAAKSPEHME